MFAVVLASPWRPNNPMEQKSKRWPSYHNNRHLSRPPLELLFRHFKLSELKAKRLYVGASLFSPWLLAVPFSHLRLTAQLTF